MSLPRSVQQPSMSEAADLVASIIARRQSVLESLEEDLSNAKQLLLEIEQRLELATKQRDTINLQVAMLKDKRSKNKLRAAEILDEIKDLRSSIASNKSVPPDPKWARERLERSLESLEERLETAALGKSEERLLLKEMQEVARRHASWVEQRRKNHPEWEELHQLDAELAVCFDKAQEAHQELIKLAESSEPFHQEFLLLSDKVKKQKELVLRLSHESDFGPEAIEFWTNLLKTGISEENVLFSRVMEFISKVNEDFQELGNNDVEEE